FFFQAEDGIRDFHVTGVQTCALPISISSSSRRVIPSGASYWPGRSTCPERLNRPNPVDFSVPMSANQSAPCSTMGGTEAIDSTRSEERRVGTGGRAGGAAAQDKKRGG